MTDRRGAPLTNVPVELRENGPAKFVDSTASSILVHTGGDGVVRLALVADGPGTSAIVAEISPYGTPGSVRGPGASDDECEQPAGPGGSPPTGRCISQTLTVSWEEPPPDLDEPVLGHLRTVNMRFAHGNEDELLVYGKLRLRDAGDDYRDCTVAQPVEVERRVDGRWKTLQNATTNGRGRYRAVVPDHAGRYRAVARRTETFVEDDALHVCKPAEKVKPHRHDR
ncbi:MAG: hypothetical protein M3323_02295 [Actinomycetota bacterium]|nr:hypothetical protein [Actinomycetota bacterium]